MNEETDLFDIVSKYLIGFGWTVLEKPSLEDNYFDLTAISSRKSLRIEIKKLHVKKLGQWQVSSITENQKKSDAVAVVFPDKSVFIEKMEDYLIHCSEGGTRQFTWLRP